MLGIDVEVIGLSCGNCDVSGVQSVFGERENGVENEACGYPSADD